MSRLAASLSLAVMVAAQPGLAQDAPLSWGQSVPVRPADANAIRDIIAHQLEAFAHRDAAAAYSATAPNMRSKFPTSDMFDTMARSHYAPLFDVERHSFTSVRAAAATATQLETWSQDVEIGTRDGERWSAIYGLGRQTNGSIAITSCVLIHHVDKISLAPNHFSSYRIVKVVARPTSGSAEFDAV